MGGYVAGERERESERAREGGREGERESEREGERVEVAEVTMAQKVTLRNPQVENRMWRVPLWSTHV